MPIMKLGVNVLNFGAHATPEAFAGWARFAEEAGFDFVMVSDHLAVTPDVAEQYPAPFYDPFTVLAWLAGTTERIGLGTTITVLPYRHPLQLARVTANLDRLSGGRLIFGVGVGWAKREYAALDVPFEQRGALADQSLEVILQSWTQDSVTYGGETIDPRPHPVQKPHPPVWVGGQAPGALRRVARFGDAWHPINIAPDRLRAEGLPALRRAAEEVGRPVPALAPASGWTTLTRPCGRPRSSPSWEPPTCCSTPTRAAPSEPEHPRKISRDSPPSATPSDPETRPRRGSPRSRGRRTAIFRPRGRQVVDTW